MLSGYLLHRQRWLMSCDSKCSVALSRGAVGWSAVCDCGIPDHTHSLNFL